VGLISTLLASLWKRRQIYVLLALAIVAWHRQQQLRSQINRFPLAEYNRLLPLVQINRDKLQQLLKAQQELSLEIARGGFDWQTLETPTGSADRSQYQTELIVGFSGGVDAGRWCCLPTRNV